MVGLAVACEGHRVTTHSVDARQAERKRLTDLVQRVSERKDKGAFGELFLHYAPRIKALLMRQGAASGRAIVRTPFHQSFSASKWMAAITFTVMSG